VECSAGKIHISEETKSFLDSSFGDVDFDIEIRGEIDVKVRRIGDVRRRKELGSKELDCVEFFSHRPHTLNDDRSENCNM